jgi:hypothetical protein
MAEGASPHRDGLAALSHYHVIAATHADELMCSEAFTWPGAQGFATDLIAPLAGAPTYEPVRAVWIIQCDPSRCPLAHGDDIPADEQAAAEFVQRVIQQREPYWSA